LCASRQVIPAFALWLWRSVPHPVLGFPTGLYPFGCEGRIHYSALDAPLPWLPLLRGLWCRVLGGARRGGGALLAGGRRPGRLHQGRGARPLPGRPTAGSVLVLLAPALLPGDHVLVAAVRRRALCVPSPRCAPRAFKRPSVLLLLVATCAYVTGGVCTRWSGTRVSVFWSATRLVAPVCLFVP